MNFAFSDEQEEFREVLRRFLEEKSPSAEVRRSMETAEGFDRTLWKQMAEELGLQGLCIPERFGGQGFGQLELEILFEEMGRVLLCAPFLSTVCLGAGAIEAAGDDAQKQALLPRIAAGDSVATLALLEDSLRWDPSEVSLVARPEGDGFRISGRKRFVTDGQSADLIVVAARLENTQGETGLTLLCVRGDAAGLSVEPIEALDHTRKQSHLELDGVSATALGRPGEAAGALCRTLDRAAVALAAESAGGAEHCLDAAVEYAKQRIQFARPIGSFQAIKHRCADLLLDVQSAKVTARWAAWVADDEPAELAGAASVAKAVAGDAFVRAAEQSLHIHGGMGFTWEADPHLYLKRAHGNRELLGNPTHHRARAVRGLGV